MKQLSPWTQALAKLRKAVDAETQLAALKFCHELPLANPVVLKSYHDASCL